MTDPYPKVVFPHGFDERMADEMWQKGYLSGAVAIGEHGHAYPVYIIDPIRLRQDLEFDAKRGIPCLAEPGLIVMPEVTVQAIEQSVAFLWDIGYFSHLRSIDPRDGDG